MTLIALSPIVTAASATESTSPTRIDIGTVVLTLAISAFLAWVAYLVTTNRRKRKLEATPKNLQPWLSDDELENKRLTRVLGSAVFAAAALALVLPVYYLLESGRQEKAVNDFAHLYIEEGEKWFQKFECESCHGPKGVGGAADFIEPRSGLTVRWAAPSINNVLYRYSEEEIRFWIQFGRRGTPMPAQGLVSGEGAMTVQEVDQVLAYLHEISIPQAEAFDQVDGAVTQALARIENGAATVARAMIEQQAAINDILDASDRLKEIADFPVEVKELLTGDGTCTKESAALADMGCSFPGLDSDRDGISDITENTLTSNYAPVIDRTVLIHNVQENEGVLTIVERQNSSSFPGLYGLNLDPSNPFSMNDAAGNAVADLESLDTFVRALNAAHLNLSVVSDRIDRFLPSALQGLSFLQDSAVRKAWEVDFEAVSIAMTEEWAASDEEESEVVDLQMAREAVGLFNAYCARCHTSGYSAGVAYEQIPGSGAWAPALTGGRTLSQFPELSDHIDFIIRGTNEAQEYGTNGLGRGWMPGFGQVLSEEDIKLIALYERTL